MLFGCLVVVGLLQLGLLLAGWRRFGFIELGLSWTLMVVGWLAWVVSFSVGFRVVVGLLGLVGWCGFWGVGLGLGWVYFGAVLVCG